MSKTLASTRYFALISLIYCLSPIQNAIATSSLDKLGSASEIFTSLQQDSTTRVIVRFKSPVATAAEAGSRNHRSLRYKTQIAAIRENILTDLLAKQPATKATQFKQRIHRKYAISPIVSLTIDQTELMQLLGNPDVITIGPDRLHRFSLQDSVPLIGMTGSYGAFSYGATGKGQVVAIVDSGVQSTHPFLNGKVIGEACFSSGTNSYHTLCPDGNDTMIGPGSANAMIPLCYAGGENVCFHGTHVAGIAAGLNPELGNPPNGVAKEASILAVQTAVVRNMGSSAMLSYYDSDLIASLEWVLQQAETLPPSLKLAAVNLSLGGDTSQTPCPDNPLNEVITALRADGVAVIVASGNDGKLDAISEPACVPGAISVGSTTLDDKRSSFSNQAPFLDLMAPGRNILSSVPDSDYRRYSGTSMATPHVTGAFAAIRSVYPMATVDQIEEAFKLTGKTVLGESYGTRRIQVDAALEYLNATLRSRLTVNKNSEQGTVVSAPAGIQCGDSCTADYSLGQNVTLSPSSAPGYRFSSWSGDCSGDGACTLVMDADRTVNAAFEKLPTYPLKVTRPSHGIITSDPASIVCGGKSRQCSGIFSDVTLIANPQAGYAFKGWVGCPVQEGRRCILTLSHPQRIRAQFYKLPKYRITVIKNKGGTVISIPVGLRCRANQTNCSAMFVQGTPVSLQAEALPGKAFAGWSGDCSDNVECTVTLDRNKKIGASFR